MQNVRTKVVFKYYSPNQILLLPPSLEEMIDPNHAVRVINQVIDNLDIDTLIRKYKGGGCSSYHPRLLLKLLVYGWIKRINRPVFTGFGLTGKASSPDHSTPE